MSANIPAFPQHGFTSSPEVAARMAEKGGMTIRQYYKAAAITGLTRGDLINASVPSLANATGRDAVWANELIAALVKSSAELADAMLREDEEHAKKTPLHPA